MPQSYDFIFKPAREFCEKFQKKLPRGQNIIKVGDTVILVTTNRGLGDIRDILKS